jgi:hypothetical protein
MRARVLRRFCVAPVARRQAAAHRERWNESKIVGQVGNQSMRSVGTKSGAPLLAESRDQPECAIGALAAPREPSEAEPPREQFGGHQALWDYCAVHRTRGSNAHDALSFIPKFGPECNEPFAGKSTKTNCVAHFLLCRSGSQSLTPLLVRVAYARPARVSSLFRLLPLVEQQLEKVHAG